MTALKQWFKSSVPDGCNMIHLIPELRVGEVAGKSPQLCLGVYGFLNTIISCSAARCN